MSQEPIEIAYRTTIEEPRSGPVGDFLRWLGRHPIIGGLICGLAVVAIAVAVQPGGFTTAPLIASIISSTVVVVWMVLFFFMRNFFKTQSFVQKSVVRKLSFDDEEALWTEHDSAMRQLSDPSLAIYSTPVPEDIGDDDSPRRRNPTAWPVWIVIDGEGDDRIVFETREPARRARSCREVSDEIIEATDERLPRAIASPLLHHLRTQDVDSESSDPSAP